MPSFSSLVDRGKDAVDETRERVSPLDHVIRAWGQFSSVNGSQQAAGVTYFGFLSLFPLLAIAFAALAIVLAKDQSLQDQVYSAVSDALGGATLVSRDELATAATGAGIFGVVSLLYTGTGLVDALRQSLHVVWNQGQVQTNIVKRKLLDVVVMLAVVVAVLVSVGVSSSATTFTGSILGLVGLEGSVVANVVLRVLTILLSLLLDAGVIAVLFRTLSGADVDWSDLWRGAVFGAVGVEVLKQLAGNLLGGVAGKSALYGPFVTAIVLLLWINYVARWLLLAAAWTVTLHPAPATGPSPVVGPMAPVGPAAGRPGTQDAASARGRTRGPLAGVVLGFVVGLVAGGVRRR